jgi:ankyrin repeat protein
MSKGDDVNAEDAFQRNALYYAIQNGYFAAVSCLVQHGADLHIKNNYGENLLHIAVKAGNSECIDFSLKHDFDLDDQDCAGDTALHRVVNRRYFEIARQLTASGAKCNIPNKCGYTVAEPAKACNADILE